MKSHQDTPGSAPLKDLQGIEESWRDAEFRLVIDDGGASGCLMAIVYVVAFEVLSHIAFDIARRLGWHNLRAGAFTPEWCLFGLSILFAIGMTKAGVFSPIQRIEVTRERFRSVSGRWTRAFDLTEIKEITIYRVGGRGGPFYGVNVFGSSGRPIQVLGRPGEDAQATAKAVCDRLRFVVAKFTTETAATGPYRSFEGSKLDRDGESPKP